MFRNNPPAMQRLIPFKFLLFIPCLLAAETDNSNPAFEAELADLVECGYNGLREAIKQTAQAQEYLDSVIYNIRQPGIGPNTPKVHAE